MQPVQTRLATARLIKLSGVVDTFLANKFLAKANDL